MAEVRSIVDDYQIVCSQVESLDDDEREMLEKYIVNRRSFFTIADDENLSPEAVRSRIKRYKKIVKVGAVLFMTDKYFNDDVEKDKRKDGKLVRTIITECFFTGEASSLTNEEYARQLQISRSTLESKKEAGMAIFGLLMWIYAVRREMEDIENGIIPRPEKRKWWMKYV